MTALAAVAVIGVAVSGGYYLGRHGDAAAYADALPSPQGVASLSGGPAVPGLCVLGQNAVYAGARVGQAATARYRQLAADLRGQLAPEQAAIQDAAKTLEAARSTMPPAQFQQREQDLAQRIRALQAANAQDSRDLEATRVKALKQIAVLANPVIADVYKSHRCGVLFSRDMMLAGNSGMDLTPDVVRGLDAKVTTLAFNLEHAAAQPQAAQ
ncbi:MAG: OmpH family outer membrane protein [Rhizomicrobium sp.]